MSTTPVLVVPLEVLTTAAVVDGCLTAASGGRGVLASLDPTGGCGGAAAAAFGRMSAAWLTELARLGELANGLAGALRASAADYARVDRSAVPVVPSAGAR